MFSGASSFNQPLNDWSVSNDVKNNMESMFEDVSDDKSSKNDEELLKRNERIRNLIMQNPSAFDWDSSDEEY